jgi:hypothetical protein
VYIIFRLHGVTSYPKNGQRLLKPTVASSCGASAKRGALSRAGALINEFIYLFLFIYLYLS